MSPKDSAVYFESGFAIVLVVLENLMVHLLSDVYGLALEPFQILQQTCACTQGRGGGGVHGA